MFAAYTRLRRRGENLDCRQLLGSSSTGVTVVRIGARVIEQLLSEVSWQIIEGLRRETKSGRDAWEVSIQST
jgi:hypothetical protein